jgi:UDPglucose--hexose-1-phosphate uridylyltransferase
VDVKVSELRRDPVTGRWVVVSTERPRADDFDRAPVVIQPDDSCPFCQGHEHMTPFEVLAYRNGSPSNAPGWDLRVVPNQSPIVRVEGELDRQGEGLFDRMNGIGAHEVLIESPRHEDTLSSQDDAASERLLRAFQDRVHDLRRDMRFKSFVPFKNFGAAAGAALEHSHSQLFALPIVPREIRDELEGARTHYAAKERCLFCDIVRQETGEGRRVIAENTDAIALAPYASRSPFETWILPRRHQSRFEETPPHEIGSVARLLRDVLRRMDRALEHPPYSFVIHSAPVSEPAEFYHWHLEILPKVTRFGAFEWATGFHRNPTLPETAAAVLREALGQP